MWLRLLLISALAVVWPPTVSAASDKILCYHGTWSHWRSGNGKFTVPDIDTNLCTHIIYAFVGINSDGTIRFNSDDLDYPGFLNLYKQLKNERNPKPKLLVAIGGWSEGSVTFSQVASNANLRKKLLESAKTLIQTYNFDGFDFDWEYPTDRGGVYADRSNFVTLLSEFRTEFNKYGYLLTAAVSASTGYYDVPGIAKSLDFIHVMTYDFAGTWNGVTGHHSSYPDSISSVNAWKNAGAPANKLVLGIGTYGRSFTLSNSNNNGVGAPISGGGTAGPYTGESGILGYNEICEKLKSGALTRKWSNELQVPYAVGGNQWVGYEDPDSIAIKGKYVVSNNLAGIMIWSVETDDFRGTCGSKYPLLNAIKAALKGSDSGTPTTTTPKPTQPQTQPPTQSPTQTTTSSSTCKSEGYIRDASDCSKYYYCQWGGSSYIMHPFQCGSGLYYDTKIGVCNWRDQVSCPTKFFVTTEPGPIWRSGNGKFTVADIDTNLCTHIIYAYVGINSDGTIRFNSDDLDYPGFLNLYKQLKNERNPKPKLIVAIGGWSEGSVTFSQNAGNANLRKKLLESAIKLIQIYNFDGFNFDWEYPTDRGGVYADRSNFVTLLSEFRTEFNKYGYLLTAAVSASTGYYDVPGIAKSLDLIYVMTCDFAGTWNGVTGHHSSYPDSISAIEAWVRAGAPREKLVLVTCTYGRSFTLSNSNNNGVGAPISGGGTAGPYTGESGILGYNEICEKLKSGALTRKWSNELHVPYAVGGNQWVGYDDPDSIAIKGKYVVSNNLAGIMIWSVETDDFRGTCGSKYPLLNAIKAALKGSDSGSPTTTTPKPTQPQTQPPTQSPTQPSTLPSTCQSEGYIRDASVCSKYYYCQWGGSSYIKYSFQCGSGLYYDTKIGVCNWRDQVSCP